MYRFFIDYEHGYVYKKTPPAYAIFTFLREHGIRYQWENVRPNSGMVSYISADVTDEDALVLKMHYPHLELEHIDYEKI